MLPKIDGIAMYPLFHKVSVGGTLPTTTDIRSVRCASKCEVAFERSIAHNLVCAGSPQGDYDRIDVAGQITKKTGPLAPPEPLDQQSLEKQRIGIDGSYRVFWSWPNKKAYSEIGATYEVHLRLIKRNQTFGGKPEGEWPQGVFEVILKPAPEPTVPKPGTRD